MVLVVNATAAVLLFPRDYDRIVDSGVTSALTQDHILLERRVCPFPRKASFPGLQLASAGAGFAAAFLNKRAGASSHVRSACGYATINWLQSLFLPASLVQNLDGQASSSSNLDCGYMLSDWRSALVAFRLVLYLVGLFWMQLLVAGRLDLLEQTSKQNYCSSCLRKLVWMQACVTAVAALLPLGFGGQVEVTLLSMTFNGTFLVGSLSFVCNVGASALAIYALTQSFLQMRRVLRLAEMEDTPVAVQSSLKQAKRFTALQVMGVAFSLVLTVVVLSVALWSLRLDTMATRDTFTWLLAVVQCFDSFGNAFAALLLSGSHRLPKLQPNQASQEMSCCKCEKEPLAGVAKVTEWSQPWKRKVEELSSRGMNLRSLLHFYQQDLRRIPDWKYVPREHKTRDVVRRAIIPLTSKEESAYAVSALNRGGAQRATVMVTHNWGNSYKDLLAAVVSDALEECSFKLAARLLEEDCEFLCAVVDEIGQLDDMCWICAFAVNQHASICHTNPYDRDPVTNELHPVCSCSCVNIHDPDGRSHMSEINKFDDMMYHLKATGGCRQVVAVDQALDLFHRAWCMAEIAEAKRLQMNQSLKLLGGSVVSLLCLLWFSYSITNKTKSTYFSS